MEIAELLQSGGEDQAAAIVREAAHGSREILAAFLASDDLWGGAGSVADQALISDDARRGDLEVLMAKLGRAQLSDGKANPRTGMWISAFEQWRRTDPECQ